jgi:hypothetical protein
MHRAYGARIPRSGVSLDSANRKILWWSISKTASCNTMQPEAGGHWRTSCRQPFFGVRRFFREVSNTVLVGDRRGAHKS